MKVLCLALATLFLSLSSVLTPALAASFSTDQSDLWYIQNESGWGMQLVQRGNTIFATLFVYGQDGTATWYVATMLPAPGVGSWSGDLYTATGPWFGTAPFNAALVNGVKVGTMSWSVTLVNYGTVEYSVNGVIVIKYVVRQTLINETYSGHFGGGIHQQTTGCANPAFNGTIENIGVLNIAQAGSSITMTSSPITGGSCTYTGTLTQYGQMGDVQGTYGCSTGEVGAFHIFEMQVTEISLNGRFTATAVSPLGCQGSGWFGGLAVTTF
jgi:hypothetical protein